MEDVEEGFYAGEVGGAAAHDEVVAFAVERDEVEVEGLGGGAGGEAGIGFAGKDTVGGGKMAEGHPGVAGDMEGVDTGLFQEFIEKGAAAGADFAVDEADVFAGEVFGFADVLGVAGGDDEAFFPAGEGDDGEVLGGEVFAEKGEVELAGLGVFEVGAGDVGFAIDHPGEGEFAGGAGGDDFDAADLFDHVGEESGGGVAAGEDDAFLGGFVFGEDEEVGAIFGAGGAFDDAIGFRHVVGGGADGDGDPAGADLADADGLALGGGFGGEDLGGDGFGALGVFLLEGEEFVDGDFELAGEVECDFGIGDVGTGLNGVDGLAADVDAASEIGGADAAAFSNLGQPVGDTHFHTAIFSSVGRHGCRAGPLEVPLEGEFEDAGIEGGGDGSEGGVAEGAVGVAQGRRVGDVEGFGSEFEAGAFGEPEGFAEHDIERLVRGAGDGVAGGVTEGELRGLGEGGGVEPAGGGALAGGEGGGGEAVGALDAEASEGVEVGRLGDGNGAAGLGAGDTGDLPAGGEGEFVDESGGKDVGDVAGGDVLFEAFIEAIGGLEVGDGTGEDGGIENGAGVVDEAGEGVGGGEGEAAGEAFFEARLEGVVCGVAGVVAIEGDGGETGEWAEELAAGDAGGAERGVGGDLAEVGVGDLVGELGTEGELFDR